MDDGRWITLGALGAVGLLGAAVSRSASAARFMHATPEASAGAIASNGAIRPGERFGADPALVRDPEGWLTPLAAMADLERLSPDQEARLVRPFPGFTYLTTSDAVVRHHVPSGRAVFEVRPSTDRIWPDEDFIGPAVVAVVHDDLSFLTSVFTRYFEGTPSEIVDWGRGVAKRAPKATLASARRIPMSAYGRYPFQIAVGRSLLSSALKDPALGRVVKDGLPLTNVFAHRGPMPVVRPIGHRDTV